MLEDKLLVWKFRHGSKDAFCRIYEKYRDDLLRLSISLLNEANIAEDVVHDVFASFIQNGQQFQLTGSLKSYLATCVANRARNVNRASQRQHNPSLDKAAPVASDSNRPEKWIIIGDEFRQLSNALAQLPYGQRETVLLRAQSGMKFRQIAKSQSVPIKTAQSRYRIGLDKLRSLLNSEATK
ncbi:MAG: RNA polymerase sigma factor [Planctomycetota bacterium]